MPQYDNDAKVTVALRTGAPKHEHEAPRDGAHVTTEPSCYWQMWSLPPPA